MDSLNPRELLGSYSSLILVDVVEDELDLTPLLGYPRFNTLEIRPPEDSSGQFLLRMAPTKKSLPFKTVIFSNVLLLPPKHVKTLKRTGELLVTEELLSLIAY